MQRRGPPSPMQRKTFDTDFMVTFEKYAAMPTLRTSRDDLVMMPTKSDTSVFFDLLEDMAWKPPPPPAPPRHILVQDCAMDNSFYMAFKTADARCVDIPDELRETDVLIYHPTHGTRYSYYTFM